MSIKKKLFFMAAGWLGKLLMNAIKHKVRSKFRR